MKIRLFITNIDIDNIKIIDNQHHYLMNVLRVKHEDEVFIFNEQCEWKCKVDIIHKKYIILQIKEKMVVSDKILNITACVPLIKPDTISRMVRQSVELGVKKIIIFNAKHSSVRHINIDKIKVITIEAIEQCGGIFLPEIIFCNNLLDALKQCDGVILYANEKTVQTGEKTDLNTIIKNDNIFVFVGPEGGFSNDEILLLNEQKNSFSINLGQRILRADTALTRIIADAIFILDNK